MRVLDQHPDYTLPRRLRARVRTSVRRNIPLTGLRDGGGHKCAWRNLCIRCDGTKGQCGSGESKDQFHRINPFVAFSFQTVQQRTLSL
jgi:hypothetical protein